MRTRSLAVALFATMAIVLSACGATATPAPAGLKIGLVTDVGTLDDKNFNQYSWEGAQDGATKVGGDGQVRHERGLGRHRQEHPVVRRPEVRHHRDRRLRRRLGHDQGRQGQPDHQVHRRRPGTVRHRGGRPRSDVRVQG